MPPVDLDKLERLLEVRKEKNLTWNCWLEQVLALIRRVERYEKALKIYADPKNHSDDYCYCGYGVAKNALKEDPDSAGPALICVDSSCPCDGGDCGCFSLRGDKICVIKI